MSWNLPSINNMKKCTVLLWLHTCSPECYLSCNLALGGKEFQDHFGSDTQKISNKKSRSGFSCIQEDIKLDWLLHFSANFLKKKESHGGCPSSTR